MSKLIEKILWRSASVLVISLVLAFVAWDVLRAFGVPPSATTSRPLPRLDRPTIVQPRNDNCVHMPDGIRICDGVPGSKEDAS